MQGLGLEERHNPLQPRDLWVPLAGLTQGVARVHNQARRFQ
jgi:hypothetical protein